MSDVYASNILRFAGLRKIGPIFASDFLFFFFEILKDLAKGRKDARDFLS